jgi:hypothetical protein
LRAKRELPDMRDNDMTPEQVISRLNQLRKEFEDDRENEDYLALTHAVLFISYQMAAFKQYLADTSKKKA